MMLLRRLWEGSWSLMLLPRLLQGLGSGEGELGIVDGDSGRVSDFRIVFCCCMVIVVLLSFWTYIWVCLNETAL